MKSVANVIAFAGVANAFWRMECHSRTGVARLDPLVDPNKVSSHGHVIHGGSNFGMSTNYDDLRASDCTSCRVKQDTSAYWTPTLNFVHENGTTEMVQQVGGMLAYYLLYGKDIQAFPKNFQMLAGDTRLRNFTGPEPDKEKSLWGEDDKTQFSLGQKALGFNCLNYKKDPEPSMYRHRMPDKDYLDANCDDGIRAEIFFPSCWNGKDTDSENHKDHMRYPDLVNDGTCPEGFETRVPSLFYETIWNTAAFKGTPGQFVFGNGDPTGCGYHGDFMTGWDVDFLQSAVNTCTDPSGEIEACPLFDIQSEAEGAKCTFETPSVLAADNCEGPADALCGNVPIQYGPGYASDIHGGDGGKPTGGYTLPTESPTAPALPYTTPELALTDKFGGGISVLNVDAGAHQPSEVNVAETESSEAPSKETPAPSPAPSTTPAPEQPEGNVVSTSTYTSAGTVYEVAIEEVVQYVTVGPLRKRHHHHMHRRDREHGLLGRRF